MKKTLSLLIAGLTITSFIVGCGAKTDEGDNASNATTGGAATPKKDSGAPTTVDAKPNPGTTGAAAPGGSTTTGK